MVKEYFGMSIRVNHVDVRFAIELISRKKLGDIEFENACEEIAKCCMYSNLWEYVNKMTYKEFRLQTRKISYIYCSNAY